MMVTRVTLVSKDKKLEAYAPGDAGQPYKGDDTWYTACPWCGYHYRMSEHAVVVIGDYITIRPSLLCTNNACNAHFYVNSSMISYV